MERENYYSKTLDSMIEKRSITKSFRVGNKGNEIIQELTEIMNCSETSVIMYALTELYMTQKTKQRLESK